jgi:phenylacetate-CoA ligase
MKYSLQEKLYQRSPIPVQNLAVSYWGRKLYRQRFGPEYERWAEFLERSERFSAEEHRRYQEERLSAIVRHAYETVPYYRRLFDGLSLRPDDITAVEDLTKLPVLTKAEVREHLEEMVSTALSRREITKVFTSGTTGDVVHFYWDRGIDFVNNACLWRSRRWAGFEFGEPYATLLGKMVAPLEQKRPPFWRVNRKWNQLFMSPHHLAAANVPLYIEALRDFGAVALDSYPSTAVVMARYLEREGDYLPLKCVFTTAEPLMEPDREIISERFRCGVFDGYGQAERVVYTAECEQHRGHHIFSEYGVCEIVDVDGMPAGDGVPGRLVGTGFHNLAMPLLRYEVGDVAAVSREKCTCGRELPLMSLTATRQGDIVTTPDGRLLPPLMVLRAFKHIEHIHGSQLIQHTPMDYTARIVSDDPVREDVARELIEGLRLRLGGPVNVKIEPVADVPRTANQKFRRVVSEVPLDWEKSSADGLVEGAPSRDEDGGLDDVPADGGGEDV